MSEAELREGLRAAVGDEPPLRFDADALIRRAQGVRAARKRRRALAAVGVATVVLVGTVLSLPGVLTVRGAVDASREGVLTTSVPGSSSAVGLPSVSPGTRPGLTAVSPSAPLPGDVDSPVVAQLEAYLPRRVAELVPGVADVRVKITEGRGKVAPDSLSGVVYFTAHGNNEGVVFRLSSPAARVTRGEFCQWTKCEDPREQPDGSVLEAHRFGSESSTEMAGRTVAHFRADGVVVEVSVFNYDPAASDRKVRDDFGLSAATQVVLATDPKLSLG